MASLLSRRSLMVNGGLAVVLAGGVAIAFMSLGDDSAGAGASKTSTSTVQRGDLSATVSASGSIASANSSDLNFSTSGTIEKIYVKAGEKVSKGEKLAKLDQTSAEATVSSAYASLKAAKYSYTSAKSAKGATTATIQSAYSQYLQAKTTYDNAVTALDQTYLYAPFAGTITTVNDSVGDSVSGSGNSASSSSNSSSSSSSGTGSTGSSSTSSSSSTSTSSGVMQLQNLSKLQVSADFTEADTTKLKVGQSATISFDALTGVTAQGKVSSIATTSTTSSNVVEYAVVVSLTTRPSAVRIGQTATVQVTTGSASGVLYVPSAAVTTAGGQKTVTVVKNGQNVVTPVTTGITGDSGVEIKSGLTEGETVVLKTTTTGSTTSGGFPGTGGGFPGGGAAPGGGR